MRAPESLRVAALALALAAGAAQAADPFYMRLLVDGSRAYERGDLEAVAHKLRIACFGLLDEPELLAEGLARLGLAQDGLGDPPAFTATYERMLELEDRFGAYSGAALPQDLRSQFEEALLRRLPANDLVLAEAPAADAAAPEADAAANPEPPAPGNSALDRAVLEDIRRLAGTATTTSALELAMERARELSDQNPEWTEAHLLAAEIAYLGSRWQDAVELFRRAGGPGNGQTALLFYYAVALYESGEWQAARAPMRRALPRMELTPFVESYRDKILGGS